MKPLWAIRILFLGLCIAGGFAVSQVRPEFTGEKYSAWIGMAIGFGFGGPVDRLAGRIVKSHHVEGWDSAQWIALDYGDVIVHVFDEDTREYYDLEHLWSSAPAFRPERQR